MADKPKSVEVFKPPSCPSCRTSARVTLESDGDSGAKVWRCGLCHVSWEVALTPRSER